MDKLLIAQCAELFKKLENLNIKHKVETINAIRLSLAQHSPFNTEPVDCVQWVPNTEVQANDYNPNTVAPPEMKLLELSIQEDGYTQPIVAWPEMITGVKDWLLPSLNLQLMASTLS